MFQIHMTSSLSYCEIVKYLHHVPLSSPSWLAVSSHLWPLSPLTLSRGLQRSGISGLAIVSEKTASVSLSKTQTNAGLYPQIHNMSRNPHWINFLQDGWSILHKKLTTVKSLLYPDQSKQRELTNCIVLGNYPETSCNITLQEGGRGATKSARVIQPHNQNKSANNHGQVDYGN